MREWVYEISTPEQLLELHTLQPDGNPLMESLARVWRAERERAKAGNRPALPRSMAVVVICPLGSRASVYKTIGGRQLIERLPFGAALAYCRERLERRCVQ